MVGSRRRLSQGGRKGEHVGDGRTRRAARDRVGRCQGRSPGAQAVRARRRGWQSPRRHQSRGPQRERRRTAGSGQGQSLAGESGGNEFGRSAVSARIDDCGGIGGPKDDVAARALFEKAAAQDHPGALERMGAFAQSGRGGPLDASAAKAYYEKAAALGNEDAKAALKRAQCPYVIKDKRGNVVTYLCF